MGSLCMAITRYIGDPGNFAGNGPVTLLGRLLDTFLSILEILIFAVPAGLVANGFSQAIEEEKKKRRKNIWIMCVIKSTRVFVMFILLHSKIM